MNIKEHWNEHKWKYIAGGSVVFAGITCFIVGRNSRPIRGAIGVPALGAIGVQGEKVKMRNVVMSNVSYFSANRQGPPSWVVRCKETGDIFTSQKSAALEMGLSPSHLSEHLRGVRENVSGNTFERICMAA